MTDVTDRLDAALSGKRMHADEDVLPLLAAWRALEPLRPVPPRSPEAEEAGLRAFLDEAARMHARAVSAPPAPRRNGWASKPGKERSPMFALAVKLVLALALGLGGVGTTALAAQGSLPNDLLYPVKLATEEVRLALTADLQARLNLLLEQAEGRATEMARLAGQNESIPEDVPLRLQTQLEAALRTAAQLGEPQMIAALEQIRQTTQIQSQLLERVRLRDPQNEALQATERALTRTREMCELGLSDPQRFRERMKGGRSDTTPGQPDATPGEGNGHGPGPQGTPCGECTPGGDPDPHRNQYGPQPTVSSGDDDGYGPGPQATPCGECTPEGDQNQYGPGPQPAESPGNGNDHASGGGGGGHP